MRFVLTGHYDPTTYIYSTEVHQHLTQGTVQVPMKATVQIKDNRLNFNIWTYEAIMAGDDPAKSKKVWADHFKMADMEPATKTWKDMSGGEWKGLTWMGEYVSWEQKCHEFHIHWTGNFASVDALWLHKRYQVRGVYKKMTWEGALMYLDDKSLQLVEAMYEQYKQ